MQSLYRHYLLKVRNLIIFFLFCTSTLFASTNDSLKNSNKVFPLKYYTINQFEYPDSVSYVYNTLIDFHNYLPKNTLGNIGLVNNDFSYKTSRMFGFNYGRNNYQNYFYTPFNLKYYNTRIPYSDIFYVFGTKQEQYFKMAFSYNIKKNWNMTFNFSRIRSKGFYPTLVPDHTFWSFSTNYKTLNNRYMLLAGFCWNTIMNSENGGVSNDSSLFNGYILNANYQLKTAFNYRRNRNVFLRQYFNIGHRVNDTLPIIPVSRFILTSEYDETAQRFLDDNPRSNYYNYSRVYYDPLKTHDSSHVDKLNNELAWKRVDNGKHSGFFDMIGVGASLKHQLINIRQREIHATFQNVISGFELNNLYSNHKLWWKLNSSYGLNGYNKDDYEIYGIISKGIIDSLSRFSISYKTTAYAPDYMYNHYLSNNFRWANYFDKVKEQSYTATLTIPKYTLALNVDYTSYMNVLYFDTLALAKQYKGKINLLSIYLKKDLSFFFTGI